jgi:hypothetical protein
MDINAEIAERIMGWEVITMEPIEPGGHFYLNPKQQGGETMGKLPDFLLKDHELLRQTMKDRGYELTIAERPPDPKKGRGRMFKATYTGQNKSVETTQSDERLAVCVAALKAHGFPLSHDNDE